MIASVGVRLDHKAPIPPGTLVLDWIGKGHDPIRADLSRLFDGPAPTAAAADFLILAACVYIADKTVLRRLAPDRWGRSIELHVPQGEPGRWDTNILARFLHDLTGDNWALRPYACDRAQERMGTQPPNLITTDVSEVTLFSGGLDSFAWAAGRVGKRAALVAHSDTTALGALQEHMAARLAPRSAQSLFRFWFRLRRNGPLQGAEFEASTRSRSLLFMAAAVAVAEAAGVASVSVPENGFISLNPPMVPARNGTLSTRTTHPRILASVDRLLREAGIGVTIENPFLHKTKGDISLLALQSGAPAEVVFGTVSCGRPSARRADPIHYGNCGYCFPCLVRRAGFHAAGVTDGTAYRRDPRTEAGMLRGQSGDDFKAVVTGLRRPFGLRDVRASGPLPPGSNVDALFEIAKRSREELRSMVDAGLSREVRAAIGW